MSNFKMKSLTALFFAVWMVIGGGVSRADVGARIYVQGWNPQQPEQNIVEKPFEDPKFITQVVSRGWTFARASICDNIKDTLRKANSGGKGITFYDINCDMARGGDLLLMPISNYNNFGLQFVLKDNYLNLHSTTPSLENGEILVWGGAGAVLGGAALGLPGLAITGAISFFEGLFGSHGIGDWANPEFKVNYDLTMDLVVSGSRGLQVTTAKATVGNVRVSPANAPASILKAATDFSNALFKTPAFNTLVTKGVEGKQIDFTHEINTALAQFNDKLKPYTDPLKNFVALGMWAKKNMISFVFSPRPPVPPLVGSISGTVHMKKGRQYFDQSGCPQMSLRSIVQTGPAPITDVDPIVYGQAPMQEFGNPGFKWTSGAVPSGPNHVDCRYIVERLPIGVPNKLYAPGPRPKVAGSGPWGGPVAKITPVGWNGTAVTTAMGKNWEGEMGFVGGGSVGKVRLTPEIDKGDPFRGRITTPVQKANPVVTPPAVTKEIGQTPVVGNPAVLSKSGSPATSPAVQRALDPAATKGVSPEALQQRGTMQR